MSFKVEGDQPNIQVPPYVAEEKKADENPKHSILCPPSSPIHVEELKEKNATEQKLLEGVLQAMIEKNTQTEALEKTTIANYGTWKSPITAEKIAEGVGSFMNLLVDPTTNTSYWTELRPSNKGRYTLVKCEAGGKPEDITTPEINVRSAVHEYGGAAFAVHEGTVFFTNFADHKIYVIEPGGEPKPLTEGQVRKDHHFEGTRFADFQVTPHGLLAIGEEHFEGKEPENFVALIDIKTGKHEKIASGYDFFTSPTISPDGKHIAYISWNHPNMPWTNTELWTAEFNEEGILEKSTKVAGDVPESVFQPRWASDGSLFFVSDREEWWNLYRYAERKVENVFKINGEIGSPLWRLQASKWAFLGDKILFTYNQKGFWKLAIFDPKTQIVKTLDREGCNYSQLRMGKECAILLERYTDRAPAFIRIDANTHDVTVLHDSDKGDIDGGYISKPKHIEFISTNGRKAYGILYMPKNKDYEATEGERPPLVVMIHGGPTSQASASMSLKTQFWTSQGFAVLDVNYGGSTGYGRTFRGLLDLNWGIVDVDDCCSGALHLAKEGLVDGDKLVIRGGSAGGYTTLAALAFKDVFKAGASHYGVADITALAEDTHKFESRYMEQLVGSFTDNKATWEERSPINSVDSITSPLIIFQGEEDPIVPPNQAKKIFEAVDAKGVKTELHMYPGEQHGFRQARHVIHSLNREVAFYREVFKL